MKRFNGFKGFFFKVVIMKRDSQGSKNPEKILLQLTMINNNTAAGMQDLHPYFIEGL